MQRSAAHAAALDHVHLVEGAVLHDPVAVVLDIPESIPGNLSRRAGKIDPAPTPVALEYAD
jgi:hypothetical protein